MNVRKTLILISLLTVAGSVPAQYAIRPGLELPEISMNELRAPLRGEPTELPSHLDNSLSDYFPSIVSQYGGSCAQAAGIHYLFTFEMNRTLDRKVEVGGKRIHLKLKSVILKIDVAVFTLI